MKPALFLLLGLHTATSALAQVRTVDFEAIPAMPNAVGSVVPAAARLRDQYLPSHHVQFFSTAPFIAVVSLGPNHATSGSKGAGGAAADGRLSFVQSNPIRGKFLREDGVSPMLTKFVSVRGDLIFGGGFKTIRAYALDGSLLAQATKANSDTTPVRVDAPGIHSFEILGNTTADIAFDDVQFEEPTECASIYTQPASVSICPSAEGNLAFVAMGVGALAYQWSFESPEGSGQFVDLGANTFAEPGSGVKFDIIGGSAQASQLHIANIERGSHSSHLSFRGRVTNACGSSESAPAQIVLCASDFTCDNTVDDEDFVVFAAAYNMLDCADPAMAAGCQADLNGDGLVDDADFVLFVAAYNNLGCL